MALTPKIVAYILSEEGIVLESYLDSVNVWTWGMGVTNASGHKVERYKDNPQSIEKCLQVGVWLLETKYLPSVVKAFPFPLSENELAAALSFHWNTGKITQTSWSKMVGDGDMAGAQHFLETHYTNNGLLTARRKRESRLFFDNVWPDLTCPIFPVSFSHRPVTSKGRPYDPIPVLEKMLL